VVLQADRRCAGAGAGRIHSPDPINVALWDPYRASYWPDAVLLVAENRPGRAWLGRARGRRVDGGAALLLVSVAIRLIALILGADGCSPAVGLSPGEKCRFASPAVGKFRGRWHGFGVLSGAWRSIAPWRNSNERGAWMALFLSGLSVLRFACCRPPATWRGDGLLVGANVSV